MSDSKKLRILFTPFNMASMPALTVEAFNKGSEVEARGLFIGSNKFSYRGATNAIRHLPLYTKKQLIKLIFSKFQYLFLLVKNLFWCDAVHMVWTNAVPLNIDLWLIKIFRKKLFIEWIGSEIRYPEMFSKVSPYAEACYNHPNYEYKQLENKENSLKYQKRFAKFKAIPITYAEVDFYINKQLFGHRYFTMQRLDVKAITPNYPSIEKKTPLLIHSPTAPVAKGTPIINNIIDELKAEGFNFEYKLLKDLPRETVLQYMAECDIFIDQLNYGGFGLACCEAMSYGKPALCYIAPLVLQNGLPEELAIVNVSKDTLKQKLIELITDASLRNKIGQLSRAYAEKYHDAEKVAADLAKIYRLELLK